jgi:MFS family permease
MSNRFKKNPFGMQISPRKLLIVVSLVSGTLSWFFLVQLYFDQIFLSYSADNSWIYLGLLLFYGVGALSAVIGSSLSEKVNRRKILATWIILGVAVTASLFLFEGDAFIVILSVLLGISFGFGFPSCAAFLADSTVPEERAKVSGIAILLTFLLIFLALIVIPLLNFGILELVLFFACFRALSLIGLALDKFERKPGKTGSWFSILSYKAFASYVIPWILFNAAAGLLGWTNIPKTPDFETVTSIGIPLAYGSIAIFGLLGGIVADRYGRKQPIIVLLVMFGVSFGLLSFFLTPLTLFIHYITYGVAWGFLLTLYLAVPGDLAYAGSKEKFYAIGIMMPLLVYMVLSTAPQFLLISVSISFLAPILSILLFASVIPVFRAAETLPESVIRKRKLDQHFKKLNKLIEKEESK